MVGGVHLHLSYNSDIKKRQYNVVWLLIIFHKRASNICVIQLQIQVESVNKISGFQQVWNINSQF